MSVSEHALRGAGGRATAIVGAWLLAICGYSLPCSGLEAVVVKDGTAAESQSVAVATQSEVSVLRIIESTGDGQSASPPPAASNTAPTGSVENVLVHWYIGPREQLAPQTSDAEFSNQPASSRMQKANSLAAADRSRDLLEALTAIPAAHIADDRPVFDFPGATAEAKNGHGTWTTRASGDIATASSPSAAASASLNDHAVPPRPFATLDDDQLADGLAMTRLALQPASQAPPPPPPPPSEESDEESIPPIPADGEPAVPSTPTDAADAKDTIAGAKKLGEEPVDDRLQFLRAEAVLLEPGEWQWDVGLVYAFQHDDVPIVTVDGLGNVTDVVEGQVRSRDLFVPFGVRYGYSHNTQLFLNAPVGWSNSELSLNGFDEVDNDGGIGDITFGSTFLLTSNECRDVMFTFAATAPTGGDPFDVNLAFPAASLGDGFWALSGDLICTRTYDPLVVFTTIGSRHYFERSHSGSDILPGSEWRWSMGVGLAVSSKVTLSARFAAAFIEETKVDGDRIPGTIQEPMSIRLAATIAQCHRWFEPFVDFGTNDDANATVFGAIYTY